MKDLSILASSLIGKSVAEARKMTEAASRKFRIGNQDGEAFALPADFVRGRITASVKNDIVTSVKEEGSAL